MITKIEIARLQGLTETPPRVSKLGDGEKILIYSRWFALEVPKKTMDPSFNDWVDAPVGAIAWREKLPPGEGAYGQAVRWTNANDGLVSIKLISDVGVALIHPSIYEVVSKHLPSPEFRVFEGDGLPVAILSEGVAIGGVAQVTV
jgi:hypothetical protein